MSDTKITSEELITLSREYVDNTMGDKKISVRKEHYYIFAISNFIATKEYFLKKRIEKNNTTVIFDRVKNEGILSMLLAFCDSVNSKNKDLKMPSISRIKEQIEIEPDDDVDGKDYNEKRQNQEKMYQSLYLFHEIRNGLSHAGNYEIKEKDGDYIVSIKCRNLNKLEIPIELFDFIAFYINSYQDDVDTSEILKNYMIYKASKDNQKYYSFESKNATNRIINLLAKTQVKTMKKTLTRTRNRSGSVQEEHFEDILDDFKYYYGRKANDMLAKISRANISDETKLEVIIELNIMARADKRLTGIKIDKCIQNIKSLLRLDKKSAFLYSHSIILFTNRDEPQDTNEERVASGIKKTIKDILDIKIEKTENLHDEEKKKIVEQYKQVMEKLLEKLPNLIRANEHKYRNSIFHNNIEFKNNKIYFWNQKDNNNQNDIRTFTINKSPEIYNLELKNIENFNSDIGEITVQNLFNILKQCYDNIEEVNEIVGKLWNINQIDSGLLMWNMSIREFIDNLTAKLKELSPESR